MGNKYVTFSFDDGDRQDIRFVEMLNKYGLKGTFNLNSGLASEANRGVYNGVDIIRLNATDYKELYEGHEVAVHGLTHPHLEMQDERTIFNEISRDKRNLEDIVGYEVVGMAYPYGTYDDRVVKIAKQCGIRYARTVETTPVFTPQKDLMRFKPSCKFDEEGVFSLIDAFFEGESEQKQVLYIWGHSYEFDFDDGWTRIENICKKLSENATLFRPATNREALLDD